MRLLTVEDAIAISEVLTPDENKHLILPAFRNMYADKSWRVRYMLAEKITTVCYILISFFFKLNFHSHARQMHKKRMKAHTNTHV